nr:hypothetical protein [uncultured Chryseobacterium sp.]
MDTKDNKKSSEEALKSRDLEKNPSPTKKDDKEEISRSSTNKSGKTGG